MGGRERGRGGPKVTCVSFEMCAETSFLFILAEKRLKRETHSLCPQTEFRRRQLEEELRIDFTDCAERETTYKIILII